MKKIGIFGCHRWVSNHMEAVDFIRGALYFGRFIRYADVNVATLVTMRNDDKLEAFFVLAIL